MNQEVYRGSTSEAVIHNSSKMPKYIWNVYKNLELAVEKHGLEIVEFRDRDTERKYRR